MGSDKTTASVTFESRDAGGITVVDPIERRRYRLDTPDRVDLEPADPGVFRFPVDTAATVRTESVELPTIVSTYVRDAEGRMLGEFQQNADASFEEAVYGVEFTSPIKLYLSVDSAMHVASGEDSVRIKFPEERDVHVGARSRHERPAGTVTTTRDPRDVLAAISTFGSAVKTTTPERSFPTLRGHPPEVELGDALSIPDGLEPPSDDVRIEVPPEFEYVYPIAPLAYYLGAPVRPGPEPRIVGDGLHYEFDDPFPASVERTLEQVFLLECVTRTEGLYPIELHERAAVEADLQVESGLDVDFAALYDAPQAERLDAFLSIPHEVVEPHVPTWAIGSRVAPTADVVETLPYLVDDLALVRTATGTPVDPDQVQNGNLHGLVRGGTSTADVDGGDSGVASTADVDGVVRHASSATDDGGAVRGTASTADVTYVQSGGSSDALEETWVGDGMPVDASKAVTQAYRNRIGRTPDTGDIEIVVVCNDAEMGSERDAADEVYGSRDDLEFDVTVRRDLTCEELEVVLSREYDLLHYIGHIRDGGFSCADGLLDVSTVDAVGVDAFVLNACCSYEQGIDLLENGAIGGIVTLSDVVNLGAVRIGKTVAQLLNCGFPLHAALDVAREESVVGLEYTVVGDGGLKVAQSRYGIPTMYELRESGDGYDVTFTTFAPGGLGAVTSPLVESNDDHFLVSGETGTFELSTEAVRDLLTDERTPVRTNGAVQMSTELVDVLF